MITPRKRPTKSEREYKKAYNRYVPYHVADLGPGSSYSLTETKWYYDRDAGQRLPPPLPTAHRGRWLRALSLVVVALLGGCGGFWLGRVYGGETTYEVTNRNSEPPPAQAPHRDGP